ncbi:hypothetical protein FB451DRAFT_1378531 [Mycena latifolia]|nr:hypothetical protein FB451DRAFT_1378531 [Mycena latifolia]
MGSEIKQDIAEVAVPSESPSSKMLESSERPKENRRTGSTLAGAGAGENFRRKTGGGGTQLQAGRNGNEPDASMRLMLDGRTAVNVEASWRDVDPSAWISVEATKPIANEALGSSERTACVSSLEIKTRHANDASTSLAARSGENARIDSERRAALLQEEANANASGGRGRRGAQDVRPRPRQRTLELNTCTSQAAVASYRSQHSESHRKPSEDKLRVLEKPGDQSIKRVPARLTRPCALDGWTYADLRAHNISRHNISERRKQTDRCDTRAWISVEASISDEKKKGSRRSTIYTSVCDSKSGIKTSRRAVEVTLTDFGSFGRSMQVDALLGVNQLQGGALAKTAMTSTHQKTFDLRNLREYRSRVGA